MSTRGHLTKRTPETFPDSIAAFVHHQTGFMVMPDGDGWLCVPWGRFQATGYGSTVFLAIADAARQLEAQEAHR